MFKSRNKGGMGLISIGALARSSNDQCRFDSVELELAQLPV